VQGRTNLTGDRCRPPEGKGEGGDIRRFSAHGVFQATGPPEPSQDSIAHRRRRAAFRLGSRAGAPGAQAGCAGQLRVFFIPWQEMAGKGRPATRQTAEPVNMRIIAARVPICMYGQGPGTPSRRFYVMPKSTLPGPWGRASPRRTQRIGLNHGQRHRWGRDDGGA